MPIQRPLPEAAILMSGNFRNIVYAQSAEHALEGMANVVLDSTSSILLQKHPDQLAKIELLFTSWGAPHLDAKTLEVLPALRGVFHAAGTIRGIVSDAFWKRNIPICSAAPLNAIPVAEYVFAQIILCLKQSYYFSRVTKEQKHYVNRNQMSVSYGSYGAVIGLVSLGQIARQLLVRLRTLDVQVQVYDPFLSEKDARNLGVVLVDLPTLFSTSDIVSLHTPLLPETEGMITGELLECLKPGAAFINTARGAVVDEVALCQVLEKRPDIQAIIDVTHPEPPPKGSPLYTLPNVFLTPHIAGSLDRECARMGDAMVEEARRLLAGEPLKLQVTLDDYSHMA